MSRILLPKFERYRAVIKETQKWTARTKTHGNTTQGRAKEETMMRLQEKQ